MILEKVILTALPSGFDKQKPLRLSVHVAPRLTTDDDDASPRELKEYPVFETWPDRLVGYRWTVEFDNGVTAPATPVEAPRADLWPRLFPPETYVRPHAYVDHAKKTLHSFPVREVLQFIESTYANLSAEGPGLPSIDGPNALTAAFGPLEGLTNVVGDSSSFWDEVDRAGSQLPDKERPDGTVVHPGMSGSSSAVNALFEAYRFYYRPGSRRPDFDPDFGPDYEEPKPKPPDFDFHDLVGLVADHPQLQRMLGLVVDLTVELEDPLGQLGGAEMVRVFPDGELPTDVTLPWTRFDLEDRWFGARPKDAFRMDHGLVRLTREFWDLFQVDVDGAALQAVGMGDVLARLTDPDQRNHETPSETGAPALRSGGFSLARQRRAEELLDSLKDHRDLNVLVESGGNLVFDAEDLVRGYRFDVFDENGAAGRRWYPLHERVTTHTIGTFGSPTADTLDPIRDEGFLKSTSASSERDDHPAPSDDLYLHETVVSWDGWSLAAPRPGKRIVEPGEGENGGTSPLARHDPGAGQLRPLVSVVTVAPKTLPMLRVGHTYRVRMRTVDLAGNSVPFSPKELEPLESELASEAQLALRFEPVPSPTVLRRHVDTEGESLEHLVIRSNGGISAKDYGAQHSYAEDSQRHVAPPKGSMQMAEFDGKFDKDMRGTPAAVTGALRTALREEGTFLDPKIVNLATGKKSISQTEISTHPAGTSVPTDRGTGLSGDEEDFDKKVAGAYAFYPKAKVELPYLPDPMAIGIAIVGYDVTGVEVINHIQPFDGKWPELAPFRIRLSELPAPEPPASPTPPTIAFSNGILEIALPKAAVVRAQVSSIFPGGRLKEFAIWDWTAQADRTPDLEAAAIGGRHWMLTPYRWLTLTHAVQQPLLVPDMTKVTVARKLGQTFASFDGPILNHARSTGRLEVFAHWTEDVDLIGDKPPMMARTGNAVVHDAQAFGFDIGPTEDMADVTALIGDVERASRHEFGDTKYRRIVYHSVATTRFREYLPPALAADLGNVQRSEDWETDAGAWLEPLVRDVRSSARPATPDVVQTLPTFRWETTDEGPKRTHIRRGKAIRVWLRRPWFSSGDGEQLGVVLEPAVRLSPGWVTPFDVMNEAAAGFARAARTPKKAAPSRTRVLGTRATRESPAGSFLAASGSEFAAAPIVAGASKTPQKKSKLKLPGTLTPEAIHAMLQPYVTHWGSDPVWASRLPQLPPVISDFTSRISDRSGLTLDEVSPQAKVSVAGHEVYFDPDRMLWYSDIEIDNGDSYYPFVRLALARYQPHSLDGAHLSRVVVADFMQLAPDRTAVLEVGQGAATITVRGYGGENITGRMWSPIFSDILFSPDATPSPNTTMRAILQRRPKEVPGDLGWEPAGPEITLDPDAHGFWVTWKGTIGIPATDDGLDRRILITEIETFPRDMVEGDPPYMFSPRDHVRERIVYADTFEL